MSKQNNDFFREKKTWSKVKDELLECYLTPYVSKILTTNRSLTYVDCFAGKGKFDDGNFGSPLIALYVMQNALKKPTAKNRHIKANFIELEYPDQLRQNLESYLSYSLAKNLTTRVVAGNYEEQIVRILNDSPPGNLFLYVDPYGIKHLDFNFFSSLSRGKFHSVEMLLNFNSLGFLRAACNALKIPFHNEPDLEDLEECDNSLPTSNAKLRELLDRVAGGDYWEKIIQNYYSHAINFYEAEKFLVEEYCKRLITSYDYVLNMPIRVKSGQSPKYRMIHATNHPDGVILMADNIYRREEFLKNIQSGGQQDLFAGIQKELIANKIIDYVSQLQTFKRLNLLMAEFFNSYGVLCLPSDFIKVLKDLENQGKITVCRRPDKTKNGKRTTFFSEEGGHALELKWNA